MTIEAKAELHNVSFILKPIADLAVVENIWQRLDASGDHSFFVSWIWIGAWLRLLLPVMKPELLIARAGGEVVGAAIINQKKITRYGLFFARQFHFNSTGYPSYDCIMIEHNGFAGPLGRDPGLWRAFASWFENHFSNVDELVVPGIMKELIVDAKNGTNLLSKSRDVTAFRSVGLQSISEGGFHSTLSRNSRQKLRRSARDYSEIGELRLECALSFKSALSYFGELKKMHVKSWTKRRKRHAFSEPFFEVFHKELFGLGVAKGAVRIMRVSAGNETIGYLYNLWRSGQMYAYQSGFNDGDPQLRPGYVCHSTAMIKAISEGVDEYDFLAGSNRLKESFSNDRYTLSWVTLTKPKLRFRLEEALRSFVQRLTASPS